MPENDKTATQAGDNVAAQIKKEETETKATVVPKTTRLSDNSAELFINEEFAKAPDLFEPISFDNAQQFKITAFFAPKYLFDDNKNYFTPDNWTFLKYNQDIMSIVIEDKLARFGIRGHMDIINTGEHLNFILDRLNCYYLVINFTLMEGEDSGIKFEPYILEVVDVSNIIDNSGDMKQMLRLTFVDMFSYICQQHSMATVLKYDPNINKRTSYREVFEVIMNYMKRFVKVNYNGIYSIKKDLLFKEDYGGLNANVQALIESSFKKMDPSCTVYEALDILLKDCGAPIRSYKNFKQKYNDFDYMLVPMFFKEEYSDFCGIYQYIFDPVDTKNFKDFSSNSKSISSFLQAQQNILDTGVKVKNFISKIFGGTVTREKGKLVRNAKSQFCNEGQLAIPNFNGTKYTLVMRPMTLRDIHMPFRICFSKGANMVSESINPATDEDGNYTKKEKSFIALNGRRVLGIGNYRYFPTNQLLVQKLWKNMVISNAGQQEGQTTTVLIEFNWIFQYYIYNFLGKGTGSIENYTSNITPSFFLALSAGRINDDSITKDFHELNANFIITRSESDLQEALIYIGKNLCSFVTQNDTYQFTIRGDLFRHPNEIIKISNSKTEDGTNPNIALNTDLAKNDYILMYTTSVTHTWEGSHYYNDISANKIYERIVNDTVENF